MLTKFRSFLPKAFRLLTKPKRYRQSLTAVVAPTQGFGGAEWVLSRALYRFAQFDLKSVSKSQRAQALVLQIRQWVPFINPGWYILWEQDRASVWAWDADRVNSALMAHRLKPAATKIIPETLLHPCHDHGVSLVPCMEGYEGQVWEQQSLVNSRWWPDLPAANEWINFQRDAAVLPERRSNAVPAATEITWQDLPWAKATSTDRLLNYGGKLEAGVILLAVVGLVAASLWYTLQIVKLRTATEERSAELKALNSKVEPIMSARGAALDTLRRINVLQTLDSYPDQLTLLAKVAALLPKDGPYLKEWEFSNGRLKVLLAFSGKLVSSEYIKLFQSSGAFRNVQAVSGNDPTTLVLNMEVVPKAEALANTKSDK